MTIKISTDFSETPGARYKNEGKYSGEEFREGMLDAAFRESKKNGEKLVIDLDGGYGYPTSFLEEAFGGLARKYSPEEVLSVLEFISYDEPPLVEEVYDYIRQANEKR